MVNPHDQTLCPKCGRMFCEGFWNEGVCVADMHFCGEPTSDGDTAAEYVRVWYEAHRETWWQRRKLRLGLADNFILGLMQEVRRVENERDRQLMGIRP